MLANAYCLAFGPDVVGGLASRAIAADLANRGAWHPGAGRVRSAPTRRSLATGGGTLPRRRPRPGQRRRQRHRRGWNEQDYDMLDLAVASYESLLERATGAFATAGTRYGAQGAQGEEVLAV
jgi:hypothetical protein